MDIRTWVNDHPKGQRNRAIQQLADAAGVKPVAVRHWIAGLRKISPEHVLAVEALTHVSRHDLRPDVFGKAA